MYRNTLKLLVLLVLMFSFSNLFAARCAAPTESKRLADCPAGYRNAKSLGCVSTTKFPLGVSRMKCRQGETKSGHYCYKAVGQCSGINSNSGETTPVTDPESVQPGSQIVAEYHSSRPNTFIVDPEKKFCLGITRVNNYLDPKPFNMESYNTSKCIAWIIWQRCTKPSQGQSKKCKYSISAGDRRFIHAPSSGGLQFIYINDRRPGQFWTISPATANGGLKIMNNGDGAANKTVLGISSKGQLLFDKEDHTLRFVNGPPPAINETYEYTRSYNQGYTVTIKSPPAVAPANVNPSPKNPPPVYHDPAPVYRDPAPVYHDPAPANPAPPLLLSQKERLIEANRVYAAGAFGESFSMYEALANEGMTDAQYYLANAYEKGKGTLRDYGRAFNWYKRVADKGDLEAHLRIANLYYEGHGVEQNYNKAAEWANKTSTLFATKPNTNVAVGLKYLWAKMAENGHGRPKNLANALNYYEFVLSSNINNEYPSIVVDVSRVKNLLKNKDNVILNKDIALAKAGDALAADRVGYYYITRADDRRWLSREDLREAMKWFSIAAEMGVPEAQLQLSVEYAYGEAFPRDMKKSEEWMNKAEQWLLLATSKDRTTSVKIKPWLSGYWKKQPDSKNAYRKNLQHQIKNSKKEIEEILAKGVNPSDHP